MKENKEERKREGTVLKANFRQSLDKRDREGTRCLHGWSSIKYRTGEKLRFSTVSSLIFFLTQGEQCWGRKGLRNELRAH